MTDGVDNTVFEQHIGDIVVGGRDDAAVANQGGAHGLVSPLNMSEPIVLHQQVLTVIRTAQNHVIDFANIHQTRATRIRNRALQVLLHFA